MVVNHNLEVNPTDGITNKSAVVARMVMIPRAWCAIIRSTGFQRRFVELLDLFDRFGSKCSVLSLGNLLCGDIVHCAALDPEIGTSVTHSNSGWDGAHYLFEAHMSKSSNEEVDYAVELFGWNDDASMIDFHGW